MSEPPKEGAPRSIAVQLYSAAVGLVAIGIAQVLTHGIAGGILPFSAGVVLFMATGWLLVGSRFAHGMALLTALGSAFVGLFTASDWSTVAGLAILAAALVSLFAITQPAVVRLAWRRQTSQDVEVEFTAT